MCCVLRPRVLSVSPKPQTKLQNTMHMRTEFYIYCTILLFFSTLDLCIVFFWCILYTTKQSCCVCSALVIYVYLMFVFKCDFFLELLTRSTSTFRVRPPTLQPRVFFSSGWLKGKEWKKWFVFFLTEILYRTKILIHTGDLRHAYFSLHEEKIM